MLFQCRVAGGTSPISPGDGGRGGVCLYHGGELGCDPHPRRGKVQGTPLPQNPTREGFTMGGGAVPPPWTPDPWRHTRYLPHRKALPPPCPIAGAPQPHTRERCPDPPPPPHTPGTSTLTPTPHWGPPPRPHPTAGTLAPTPTPLTPGTLPPPRGPPPPSPPSPAP